MHQQPAFSSLKPVKLEVTERVSQHILSLPLYGDMPEDHVSHVVESVEKVLQLL